MLTNRVPSGTPDWQSELPVLVGRIVTLRELAQQDLGPLVYLLSLGDATRFGLEQPIMEMSAQELIDRARGDRAAGTAGTRGLAGLIQVRPLAPGFETAEWECTIAPSSRGAGMFLEAARLLGSFTFGTFPTHRLEARVMLQNGRAIGAMRKLGAAQEGVLRRSLRRGAEYVDQVLWSILEEDWGEHWMSTAGRVH